MFNRENTRETASVANRSLQPCLYSSGIRLSLDSLIEIDTLCLAIICFSSLNG